MPETIIGYTPDVGATYYLNQLDGEVGTYLALTGNTVVGRGCLDLGLATHFVPSHLLDELHERFELTGDPDKYGGVQAVLSMVEDYEAQAPRLESAEERKRRGLPPIEWDAAEPNSPTRFVGAVREALDEAFSKSTVAAINDSLTKMVLADSAVHLASADAQKVSAWAKETLATMASRSQISMEVTLLGMRRAAKDGTDLAHKQRESKEELPPNAALKRAFEREYRAVEQFVVRPGLRLALAAPHVFLADSSAYARPRPALAQRLARLPFGRHPQARRQAAGRLCPADLVTDGARRPVLPGRRDAAPACDARARALAARPRLRQVPLPGLWPAVRERNPLTRRWRAQDER